jgi:hypothetical protein
MDTENRSDAAAESVLFKGWVRATDREGRRVRVSLNWVVARWTRLIVTPSELRCGNWSIPCSDVEDAEVVTVATGRGVNTRRLILGYRGRTYQFVLNPFRLSVDPFWDGPLPFSVRRESHPIEFSWGVGVVLVSVLCILGWALLAWL